MPGELPQNIPLFIISSAPFNFPDTLYKIFFIPGCFVILPHIIGLVSLFKFSYKFFYLTAVLTITLFLIENIKINPYQYVWFNLPSRYIDLTNKFELEYQGLSGREIAEFLNDSDKKNLCILANPIHSVKPFLNKNNFNCFDSCFKIFIIKFSWSS